MNDPSVAPKETSFNLEKFVDYTSGSIVSKSLLKRDLGNISHALKANEPFKMLLTMIRSKE